MRHRLATAACIAATFTGGVVLSSGAQAHRQHLCSLRSYPVLHQVVRNYLIPGDWHSRCSQYPVKIHVLLQGHHYRVWLRRFIITHGGLPGGDLLLGA